jgi:hypothetical protein
VRATSNVPGSLNERKLDPKRRWVWSERQFSQCGL